VGLFGINPALRQDMVLDSLIVEPFEGGREVLHALVQLDQKVGPTAVDFPTGVQLLAQRFKVLTIDPARGQNGLLNLS
jgi:hypothetical protein